MPVLTFKGKSSIESYHHTVPHHTLEFDRKMSVLRAKDEPSLSGNLIIEGDNLLALKALLPTHSGRIKCIYIDPPYNTGDEGWIYNDNLTQPQFKEWIGNVVGKEGEDATRHDKWCCMMYPRLQLLKELLTDDGVIFVSIDDNEVHNLAHLMDEVFGPENRVERLVWKKTYGGGAKERHIVTVHEYILCYARNLKEIGPLQLNPDPNAVARYYKYKDDKYESRGPYRIKPLEATKSMETRKNLVYAIPGPGGKPIMPKRQWWWSKERTMEALKNDELVFTKADSGYSVSYKQYLRDESGEERGAKLFSILDGPYTQEGTADLKKLFDGQLPLAFPKPVRLIQRLIELVTEEGDVVLDSFAGSGTTAQAVLEENAADDGKRKFILIQLPQDSKEDLVAGKNICRDVTAVRVRKVIEGYAFKNQKGETEKVGGQGGSFTYAKLGQRLLGEYREFSATLPSYDELARYVFYTETSRDLDLNEINRKSGKLGQQAGSSFYLLYSPAQDHDQRLDAVWLESVLKTDKSKQIVVYCEKIWIHRDDLARIANAFGRKVRPMLVPFNLK